MSQKSIGGNAELAKAIKERRLELKLTIEEAANKADVGIKTWCRYEAGESIRHDKVKGLCKALNWRTLPDSDENEAALNVDEYKSHKLWSKFLEENFGETAALSFIIGSEILEDHINEDITALMQMPKGSHIGELDISFIADDLPEQFFTQYDYDFLYAMKCFLNRIKAQVENDESIIARSVMEELILYLIIEESRFLIEETGYVPDDGWDEWIFDLFDDIDLVTFLYSGQYISADNAYHFNHWLQEQFFVE